MPIDWSQYIPGIAPRNAQAVESETAAQANARQRAAINAGGRQANESERAAARVGAITAPISTESYAAIAQTQRDRAYVQASQYLMQEALQRTVAANQNAFGGVAQSENSSSGLADTYIPSWSVPVGHQQMMRDRNRGRTPAAIIQDFMYYLYEQGVVIKSIKVDEHSFNVLTAQIQEPSCAVKASATHIILPTAHGATQIKPESAFEGIDWDKYLEEDVV